MKLSYYIVTVSARKQICPNVITCSSANVMQIAPDVTQKKLPLFGKMATMLNDLRDIIFKKKKNTTE